MQILKAFEDAELMYQLQPPQGMKKSYLKGDVIYGSEPNDSGIHQVQEGMVATYLQSNRTEAGMELLEKEDFFGSENFFSENQTIATCVTNVTTLYWDKETILNLCFKNPLLSLGLLKAARERSERQDKRLLVFCGCKAGERLAEYLIARAEQCIKKDKLKTYPISLSPMSHELLSKFVGTSREIITQFMTRFRRQGLISYTRKSIEVFDPIGLRDASHKPMNHSKSVAA
jgi:CRP-like cAMP-binding protein